MTDPHDLERRVRNALLDVEKYMREGLKGETLEEYAKAVNKAAWSLKQASMAIQELAKAVREERKANDV